MSDEREQVGATIGSAVAKEAKRTRAEEIRAAQHDVSLFCVLQHTYSFIYVSDGAHLEL